MKTFSLDSLGDIWSCINPKTQFIQKIEESIEKYKLQASQLFESFKKKVVN